MNKIDPISAGFKPIASIGAQAAQEAKPAGGFYEMLKSTMAQANETQITSDKMMVGLATGEVDNIHKAVGEGPWNDSVAAVLDRSRV